MQFLRFDRGVLKIYRRLLGYVAPFWRIFALAILGMVVYALTQPAFAALVKPLLDKGFLAQNSTSHWRIPLAVVAIPAAIQRQ